MARIATDDITELTCKRCRFFGELSSFTNGGIKNGYIWEVCKECYNKQKREEGKKKVENGICYNCKEPVVENKKHCKKCLEQVNKCNRATRRDIKRKAVEYLGGKCVDCGLKSGWMEIYDFHHLDPAQKDFKISQAAPRNMKWDKIAKELDKCILLCSNCHRIKHAKEIRIKEEFNVSNGV